MFAPGEKSGPKDGTFQTSDGNVKRGQACERLHDTLY